MLELFHTKLPAELRLNVFSQLGADATPGDWMAMGLVCKKWREDSPEWFEEWLRIQPFGRSLWTFAGAKVAEGLGFLRDHLSGK
jgi:hypothetical protein